MGRHLALQSVSVEEADGDASALVGCRLAGRGRIVGRALLPGHPGDGLVGRAARGSPLIRAPLSTTSVLDEAAEAVRIALPWTALLTVTVLPWRFLLIAFADRLIDLGADAPRYGNALRASATLAMLAFLLSRWGRLVYARAIRLVDESGTTPGVEALRVRPAALANYIFLATFIELLSAASAITLIAPLLCTAFSGLAVGTAELNQAPSIAEPFRAVARTAKESRLVAALLLVFICAFFAALVNVAAALYLLFWLAGATGTFDAVRWAPLFNPGNRRFVLTAIGGTLLALEPFWIAAHVMLVRKAGAAQSGEDLRVWFEELRRA